MGWVANPARVLKRAAVFGGFGLVLAQLIPVTRTNPPVQADIPASTAVSSILRRACYDCHSNETVWPWYSRVAPVSWLVARDVNHGREHLNFSEWNRLTPAKQAEAVREIWKQVSEGEMPMTIYLPMHPEARLSDRDKAVLKSWAEAASSH